MKYEIIFLNIINYTNYKSNFNFFFKFIILYYIPTKFLQEKKKKQERKKSILYLIENYLRIEGYG